MKQKTAGILRELSANDLVSFERLDEAAKVLDAYFDRDAEQVPLFDGEPAEVRPSGLGIVNGGTGPEVETKPGEQLSEAPRRRKLTRYKMRDPWSRFSKAVSHYERQRNADSISRGKLRALAMSVGFTTAEKPIAAFIANGRLVDLGDGEFGVESIDVLIAQARTKAGLGRFNPEAIAQALCVSRSRVMSWYKQQSIGVGSMA